MISLKKAFALALTTVLSMGILSSCGGASTPKEGLSRIDNPKSKEDYMNNAKIESLTNLGNTYRLKKAIEKARKGEDVNIVYIGGSITEGDGLETCYANRSYNYFKDTFGKGKGDNVHYFNSGISGTPSTLGSLRFENDVLSHQPDIIFIEFAVNDGDDEDMKAAYEAMIRNAFTYETKPAVILLFARMEAGWTSQGWKKEIGFHYDVPMISYADGITYLFDNKAMEWSEFSSDYTHPHAEGNAVVADFIAYFYDEVDRNEGSAEDVVLPDEWMFPKFFDNATMLKKDTAPSDMGAWKKGSTGFHYSDGWTKSYSDKNDPMVFEFEGKCAYVIYPNMGSSGFGTLVAKVYLDGELVATKEFKEYEQGGWSCPYVGVLHRSASGGSYKVEFTAKEDNPKCDLQVLAVAYTK